MYLFSWIFFWATQSNFQSHWHGNYVETSCKNNTGWSLAHGIHTTIRTFDGKGQLLANYFYLGWAFRIFWSFSLPSLFLIVILRITSWRTQFNSQSYLVLHERDSIPIGSLHSSISNLVCVCVREKLINTSLPQIIINHPTPIRPWLRIERHGHWRLTPRKIARLDPPSLHGELERKEGGTWHGGSQTIATTLISIHTYK